VYNFLYYIWSFVLKNVILLFSVVERMKGGASLYDSSLFF